MKRGVGYCTNLDCSEYVKGVFLINHGETFFCPACRQDGFVEPEKARSVRGKWNIYSQVQIRYNFDAMVRDYAEIAIVTDENLPPGCSTLVINSPLVKTERRAMKLAESFLSNAALNGLGPDGMPASTERVLDLSWSKDRWELELLQLQATLEESPFFTGRFEASWPRESEPKAGT